MHSLRIGEAFNGDGDHWHAVTFFRAIKKPSPATSRAPREFQYISREISGRSGLGKGDLILALLDSSHDKPRAACTAPAQFRGDVDRLAFATQ